MVPGVALDGALIHARDANGVPVGNFTDKGGVFLDFPGCGKNKEGGFNGVVHSKLITCNSSYTLLSYNAPKNFKGKTITLRGLSVTDNGFGVWTVTFPVTLRLSTNDTIRKLTTHWKG